MKIKGILLTLMIASAIMLGLVPVVAQTVSAAAHEHNEMTFTEWTDANALPQDGGSYYLREQQY